jgi:hypothetical protein
MNMINIARITIGTFCLFTGFVLWLCIPSYFFIVRSCKFNFDNYCAENSQQAIMRYGQEKFVKKPFQKITLESIKTEFPFISHINAHYYYGGNVYCSLKAFQPFLTINDKFVMAGDGHLYDMSIFATDAVSCIPSIQMTNESDVHNSQFFKRYVNNFPLTLFKLFSIKWVDHTFIELHDKNSPQFFLVSQYETNFDKKLLHYYEQIKQQIMSQRSYAKKQWRIDVRFKNQIIVTQRDVGDS